MPGVPIKPLVGLAKAAVPAVEGGYAAVATKYRPIIDQLKKILSTPSVLDPTEIALSSRVTPHRVSPNVDIRTPKGFSIPPGMRPTRASDINRQLAKQEAFEVGGAPIRLAEHSTLPGVKSQPGHSGVSTATPKTPLLGQVHKFAGESARRRGKLIDQDVRDIRAATGRASDVEKLAEKYGVSKASIRAILSRSSYVHVK